MCTAACFTLVSPRGTVVVRCPSAEVKQTWAELISDTIENLIKINRAANESRQQVTIVFDKDLITWTAELSPMATCKQIDSDQYREQVLDFTQQQLGSLLSEQGAALSKLKVGTPSKVQNKWPSSP